MVTRVGPGGACSLRSAWKAAARLEVERVRNHRLISGSKALLQAAAAAAAAGNCSLVELRDRSPLPSRSWPCAPCARNGPRFRGSAGAAVAPYATEDRRTR